MMNLKFKKGQALAEIAVFGAVLIFLLGVIIRSHLSSSYTQNYKVRATKMALKTSYEGAKGGKLPNTARNSASVLFVEDRLSPDLNKYSTLDRAPFIASGSGTLTNMLMYPVDYSSEYKRNVPIMDLYVNGQHIELTTSAFVYRTLYTNLSECPDVKIDPAENARCKRQLRETVFDSTGNASYHNFFSQKVNGTAGFNASCGDECWNLLREEEPAATSHLIPEPLRPYMAWQWQSMPGKTGNFDFGSSDDPKYPSYDISGSLQEQTIYYITKLRVKDYITDPNCRINGNPYTISIVAPGTTTACGAQLGAFTVAPFDMEGDLYFTIASAAVMDSKLGDYNAAYDSKMDAGPQPGMTEDMKIYTNVDKARSSYLEIREGKLYNNTGLVRSVTSKDKVDLISRTFQLSNDTRRLCRASGWANSSQSAPINTFEDGEENPVKACAYDPDGTGCLKGDNFMLTCFDVPTRKLYIRTNLLDKGARKWFTDVTQGL